jgi:hypothetical protein
LGLVFLLNLMSFELIEQLSLHWKESSNELCHMALWALTCVGLIWVVLPAFPRMANTTEKLILRVALFVAFVAGVWSVDYSYSWHIRPNLAFYREPDWVANHPGFQKELRQRQQQGAWLRRTGL